MVKRRRDRGSALALAVAAAAVFSYLSLDVLSAGRARVTMLSARLAAARMDAAADAGLALALARAGARDPAWRWAIDGRPYGETFDGYSLTITIEDERGKVPLNDADGPALRRLFAAAGVEGDALVRLVAAIEDWRDEDQARRPFGAEADDYRELGLVPRDGPFRTVEELLLVRGMTPALLARVAPALTVFANDRAQFDESTAPPLALAAMRDRSVNSVEVQERTRLRAGGNRPALEIADGPPPLGRPLSIRVAVAGSAGDRMVRVTIATLTGGGASPVEIRYRQ